MSLFMSRPRMRASPLVGESSVVSILIVVVLPAPLGPISPKSSPFATRSDMPPRATVTFVVLVRNERVIYSLLRSVTSMALMSSPSGGASQGGAQNTGRLISFPLHLHLNPVSRSYGRADTPGVQPVRHA